MELLLMLVAGTIVAASLFFATGVATKWMAFIFMSVASVSAIFIIREREKFFCYAFFFCLSINLDAHLVHVTPTVFRPINGLAIHIYDIPFFFLMVSWGLRVLMHPSQKINFVPIISVPFLIIIAIAVAGMGQCRAPGVINITCILVMIECLLVFLYMANNITDRRTILIIIAIMLSTLIIQAMLGFAQKLTGGHLGLGLFGEAEQGFRQMRAGSGFVSRVGGTIGSPNKLAAYIGLLLPVNLALLFAPINKDLKLFALWPLFLMAGVLEVITFSRGGWMGLGLGGSLAFYWCMARVTKRRVVSLILLVIIMTSVAAASIGLLESVRRRLFDEDYGAAYTRIPMNIVAVNMTRCHPWKGVGIANYTAAAKAYDTSKEAISYVFPMPVHNEFLLISSELGIVALACFLIILSVVFVLLFRLSRSEDDPVIGFVSIGLFGGMLAWCVHFQFEFTYVLLQPGMWAYFGLVTAMYRLIAPGKIAQRV